MQFLPGRRAKTLRPPCSFFSISVQSQTSLQLLRHILLDAAMHLQAGRRSDRASPRTRVYSTKLREMKRQAADVVGAERPRDTEPDVLDRPPRPVSHLGNQGLGRKGGEEELVPSRASRKVALFVPLVDIPADQ